MNLAHYFNDFDVGFLAGEVERMKELVIRDRYLSSGVGFADPEYVEVISDTIVLNANRRLRQWAQHRNFSEWTQRLAFIYLCRHCQEILRHPKRGNAAYCLDFKENLSLWEDAILQFEIRIPDTATSRALTRL